MVDVVSPIHIAAVGMGNLRFFRSHLEGPRFSWFAVEDMFRCLSMDRGLRRTFHYRIKHEWKNDVRTVWTDTGETLIAPHFMAQGLIDSMIEMKVAGPGLDLEYARAAAGAMTTLTAGMTPAESVTYSVTAYRIENGIPGPHPVMTEHVDKDGRRIIR